MLRVSKTDQTNLGLPIALKLATLSKKTIRIDASHRKMVSITEIATNHFLIQAGVNIQGLCKKDLSYHNSTFTFYLTKK